MISVAALVFLFALFLIIGTALFNKTSEDSNGNKNHQQNTDLPQKVTLPAAQIIGAHALPLLKDGSTFAERLSSLEDDVSAVTIDLNTPDGTLKYLSSLSGQLGFLSSTSDASSLANAISRTDDHELYVSALLYVPSFSEENDLLREVYLSAWCSVAVEAMREGVDDCLLVPRGASAAEVGRVCELAALIRATEPDAIVGCVIPEDILGAENKEVLIAELAKAFNYLSLDTTNHKDDEDVTSYVEARISQFQAQLIYYKMRVLLPFSDNPEDMQKYIDTAKKYNISSWQIKP
jgi:hypothetical protein